MRSNSAGRTQIARKVSYKQLLKNRDFGLLVFAQGISNLGDWLIVGILVATVTEFVPININPALAIAGLWIAKIAPSLFFSPFIGALVDRVDRKKGMIYSDIIRAALVASLPLAGVLGGLFYVYLIIFLSEIFTLFFVPAKDASIPNLVKRDQLVDANSLSFTVNQATMLIGLGLGTTVILVVNRLIGVVPVLKSFAGTNTAIYLDAFTFVLSAIAVGFIHMPKQKVKVDKSIYHTIFEDVKDTFRFIGANPKIKSIIISVGVSALGLGTILVVGPQYAQVDLRLGRDGFLILLTMLAVGLVIGAVSSSWLTHIISKESLFSSSLMIVGLSLIGFAVYPAVTLAIIFSIISGFGLGILYVSAYTIFHEQVSDEIRGRLFTALEADLRLALIVSLLVTSALAATIKDQTIALFGQIFIINSSQIVLFGGGVIVFLVSLYGFKVTRALTRKDLVEKVKATSD